MKVLIISDIHGNWQALQAVLRAEPDADQILCLGDLVTYGPQPVECVTWARQNLKPDWLIQGNHDHALGFDDDPHCSLAYQCLAAATLERSKTMLTFELKHFLAQLAPLRRLKIDAYNCVACHAVPSDPLFHYMTEVELTTQWESELNLAGFPDFLFVGHTHLPIKMHFRETLVVNPGSVGQPKDHDPRAAYAVWIDGDIYLKRAPYDVEQTIRAYTSMRLDSQIVR